MENMQRRESFEKNLGLANTITGGFLLLLLNFLIPLLGAVLSYFWLRYRNGEDSFGKRVSKMIGIGIFGIVLAPLAYLAAIYNVIMFYLE